MVGAVTNLIIGSAPDSVRAETFARNDFSKIIAINNAWRIRSDFTHHIYPEDFPEDRRPPQRALGGKQTVVADDYVPIQNQFGGFVYAGGTMAFTAGYWALGALEAPVLAFLGCDMVYDDGQTHFYGTGEADPLREDVTLRNLEAKAARLFIKAAQSNVLCVNLTEKDKSRLVFPKVSIDLLHSWAQTESSIMLGQAMAAFDQDALKAAEDMEASLNYFVESGRYWKQMDQFDPQKIDELDDLWLKAFGNQ